MSPHVGTYTLEDLLAQRFVPASQFGFDSIARAIQAHLDWINGQISDQVGLVAESSDDVRRIYGATEEMDMAEVDEVGVGRTQKVTTGYEVDFPLRKFSRSSGWTNEFINRATPRDIALKVVAIQSAYFTRFRKELAAALFNKTNYNFVDRLGDGTTLAIKRLLNADGSVVPSAPDGTSFAGTHQHYMGTAGAALAYTDIDLVIANVTEHGHTDVALFINQADVATLVGLATTKFTALTIAELAVPGRTSGTIETSDFREDPANKKVGFWGSGYPVYTRSWVPDNYYFAMAKSAAEKPLVHRLDRFDNLNGLRMVYQLNSHPLTTQTFEAEIGFGVWGRDSAAILKGDAQTTYVAPSGLIR